MFPRVVNVDASNMHEGTLALRVTFKPGLNKNFDLKIQSKTKIVFRYTTYDRKSIIKYFYFRLKFVFGFSFKHYKLNRFLIYYNTIKNMLKLCKKLENVKYKISTM